MDKKNMLLLVFGVLSASVVWTTVLTILLNEESPGSRTTIAPVKQTEMASKQEPVPDFFFVEKETGTKAKESVEHEVPFRHSDGLSKREFATISESETISIDELLNVLQLN